MSLDSLQRGVEIARLLALAAQRSAPAYLMEVESGLRARALLARADRDAVELRLLDEPDPGFAPYSVVCVAFNWERSACYFLTSVLPTPTCASSHSGRVALALPTEVASMQRRLSYRIPIVGSWGLEARLRRPHGASQRVEVINLSLSGALIELVRPPLRPPAHRSVLLLELTLGDVRVTLRARVRRRERGRRCALMFEELHGPHGELHPPPALERIVKELERRWLRQRLL